MPPTPSRWLAAASALAALGLAAERPRYGGVLRVETQSVYAEPAQVPGVSECLTRLDARGVARPALAVSWRSDAAARRWRFRLRSGLKFHDGTAVTPAAVAAALESAVATAEGISIQLEQPNPRLPADLASPRHSIPSCGSFRIAQFEPGRRAVLAPNEDHWEGRPFLDSVTIEMGRAPQQQLLALELGKADLVEVAPADVRRAANGRLKLWSTAPLTLVAVRLERVENARLRAAVALSIDRAAIHSVLFQKQGEVAAGVLPGWMTGYAFLFPTARDTSAAKELAGAAPPPLTIGYDAADPLARLIAERVALNARDAGLRLTASPQSDRSDLFVVRSREPLPGPHPTPDALYAAERVLIEEYRVVPLVHLPDTYASSRAVRSWNTPGLLKHGLWRFDDLWLAPERP